MENGKPLKWKLKLTAELARGECVEYDVTGWERGAEVTLGSLGLSLAEGKAILAEIQTRMVAAQIECHGEARRCCGRCGRRLPNKGKRQSIPSIQGSELMLDWEDGRKSSGHGSTPSKP